MNISPIVHIITMWMLMPCVDLLLKFLMNCGVPNMRKKIIDPIRDSKNWRIARMTHLTLLLWTMQQIPLLPWTMEMAAWSKWRLRRPAKGPAWNPNMTGNPSRPRNTWNQSLKRKKKSFFFYWNRLIIS